MVIPNYAAITPNREFRVLVCNFLLNFLLLKVEVCFGKVQNTIIPLQNLLESFFLCTLKIPILPYLCKPFLNTCPLRAASQKTAR